MTTFQEVGPAGSIPASKIVEATQLVKEGRWFTLAASRFPGMPLFPGHPPFQVTSYRTPQGIRAEGAQPWGPPNDAGLGYMAEVVSATSHSGTHFDALAHMTVGPDNHWYGGGNTADHLTDWGPRVGDAEKLPPFFTRGVLLDAAGYRGVEALPAGSPVDADEMEARAAKAGVTVSALIGSWCIRALSDYRAQDAGARARDDAQTRAIAAAEADG